MAKNNDTEHNAFNLILNGTKITGDIETSGDIRIDGQLKGNININGKLVVGVSGVIEGDISCKNADILGKIEGTISASELISLKNTSKIVGNIITNKLAVEPGAFFTGSCDMAKDHPHEKERKQKTDK